MSASSVPLEVRPGALPPGPRGTALQTLLYFRDPLGYYRRAERRFGPLFTIPTFRGRILVTGEPEGAREIFGAPSRSFTQGFGSEVVLPIVGPGSLLTLFGDAHRRERKRLSPSFHGARMRAYGDAIVDTTHRVAGRMLAPGAELPSIELGRRIALEVILRAIFGIDDDAEVDDFGQTLVDSIEAVNPILIFAPVLQRELGGVGPWARFRRIRERADARIYALIREAMAHAGEREDILSQMAAEPYEDGGLPTEESLHDSLLTLTVAGHETTATALAWCIDRLHRSPDTLRRLREELDALGPDPAPEALAALPYLEGVVRETLRLHPAIPDVLRRVEEGFTLRGVRLEKDATVAVSIPIIHANPDLYPEPDRFRPERFLERRFGPHEYVSFGGGHRHCIGSAFAMNEAKLVLGTLLSRWSFELVEREPPRTGRRNVTLVPEGGVPVRVQGRRRTSAAVGAGGPRSAVAPAEHAVHVHRRADAAPLPVEGPVRPGALDRSPRLLRRDPAVGGEGGEGGAEGQTEAQGGGQGAPVEPAGG